MTRDCLVRVLADNLNFSGVGASMLADYLIEKEDELGREFHFDSVKLRTSFVEFKSKGALIEERRSNFCEVGYTTKKLLAMNFDVFLSTLIGVFPSYFGHIAVHDEHMPIIIILKEYKE
jgi:hypothetical protein